MFFYTHALTLTLTQTITITVGELLANELLANRLPVRSELLTDSRELRRICRTFTERSTNDGRVREKKIVERGRSLREPLKMPE